MLFTYLKSILSFGKPPVSPQFGNFLEYPASARIKILRAAGRDAKKAQEELLARYESRFKAAVK